MPTPLTGIAVVCVPVFATHHSTIAHPDTALTPWWRPVVPTRTSLTVHARVEPQAQADLADAMSGAAPAARVTGGIAVHTARTAQETTVQFPGLGTCVYVPQEPDRDVEIAGTDPRGVAAASPTARVLGAPVRWVP
ncbi:hypothetical protein [Streptomyces sp. SID3343]|uniref:hypothetical protein n=1 Tax=Streptomyces sp. SID3343 TaxID=2690260 RepID=UPI0013692A5A|nr:hypothetical protein [Streptomyces sp. SID3343]MYV99663.1 hypothetical protein [Streptomyces sp. SID3343]